VNGFLSALNSSPLTGDSSMMWAWAMRHPLLFTIIQVMHPYMFVIVAVIAINIINRLFRKVR
jgi:hypothetical protein